MARKRSKVRPVPELSLTTTGVWRGMLKQPFPGIARWTVLEKDVRPKLLSFPFLLKDIYTSKLLTSFHFKTILRDMKN